MTTVTSTTTTAPTSIAEAHALAGDLLATLGALGYIIEYVTVSVGGVGLQVNDPSGVAAFLGGLVRIDYDVDGVRHHHYTGQWRGVALHVGPLAA